MMSKKVPILLFFALIGCSCIDAWGFEWKEISSNKKSSSSTTTTMSQTSSDPYWPWPWFRTVSHTQSQSGPHGSTNHTWRNYEDHGGWKKIDWQQPNGEWKIYPGLSSEGAPVRTYPYVPYGSFPQNGDHLPNDPHNVPKGSLTVQNRNSYSIRNLTGNINFGSITNQSNNWYAAAGAYANLPNNSKKAKSSQDPIRKSIVSIHSTVTQSQYENQASTNEQAGLSSNLILFTCVATILLYVSA